MEAIFIAVSSSISSKDENCFKDGLWYMVFCSNKMDNWWLGLFKFFF